MIGSKLVSLLFLYIIRVGFIKGNEGRFLAVTEEEMTKFMEEGEPKYIGSSSARADCYQGFFGCEPFADTIGIGAL